MQRISAVLTFAALLVVAPAAEASGVSYVVDKYVGGFSYGADGGEANDLLLAFEDGGRQVRIQDRREPIDHVGGQCRRVDPATAVCPADLPLHAMLHDGDDRLEVSGRRADGSFGDRIEGGAGNDVLTGGTGKDFLQGGAGEDVLTGGDGTDGLDGGVGRDQLAGGGGDDYLEGGGDRDALDGGAGRDTIGYPDRTVPAVVDLLAPAGVGGAPGEDDAIRGMENVVGARGPDELSGDDGPNVLDGVLGDDTLRGRGGPDVLRGRGNFDAGPGDDLVQAMSGDIDCGPGTDRVDPGPLNRLEPPRPAPRLDRDCETVVIGSESGRIATLPRLRLPRRAGRPFVLACPRTRRCSGSLDGRRFVVRAGRRKAVRTSRRRAGLHRLVLTRRGHYDDVAAFRLR